VARNRVQALSFKDSVSNKFFVFATSQTYLVGVVLGCFRLCRAEIPHQGGELVPPKLLLVHHGGRRGDGGELTCALSIRVLDGGGVRDGRREAIFGGE